MPSAIKAAPLFVPGLGPGTPFRFGIVGGGANELLSVVATVVGTGVVFDSEGSSDGEGSTTWGAVSDEV